MAAEMADNPVNGQKWLELRRACAKTSLLDNASPGNFVLGREHVITGAAFISKY